EQYADFTFSNNLLQYELNRFISLMPKNGKILDLGCGSGRDVQYFIDYSLDAMGIDASEKLIEEGKRRVPTGKFEVMDITKLNFEDGIFDGVWAQDSISYVSKDELGGVLKKVNSILKSNGMFFVSVRKGSGEKTVKHEKVGEEEIFTTFFTKEELEEYLKKNGFEIMNSYIQEGEDYKWVNIFAKKS
ncbi:MAG: class I SAM-dependent methyltransferase, partial [Nanoarchaeota archaeon]|nr:class I SAM-dependent methyltransferase [Nanoarchaeota archaeon]